MHVAAMIFAALGAGVTVFRIVASHRIADFVQEGEQLDVSVIEKNSYKSGNVGTGRRNYWITLAIPASDEGGAFTHELEVGSGDYEQLDEGEVLTVYRLGYDIYWPSETDLSLPIIVVSFSMSCLIFIAATAIRFRRSRSPGGDRTVRENENTQLRFTDRPKPEKLQGIATDVLVPEVIRLEEGVHAIEGRGEPFPAWIAPFAILCGSGVGLVFWVTGRSATMFWLGTAIGLALAVLAFSYRRFTLTRPPAFRLLRSESVFELPRRPERFEFTAIDSRNS